MLSELVDKHTQRVLGLPHVELVELRDDLVDPMEQLSVIKIHQSLFVQLIQEEGPPSS